MKVSPRTKEERIDMANDIIGFAIDNGYINDAPLNLAVIDIVTDLLHLISKHYSVDDVLRAAHDRFNDEVTL